MYVFDLDGVLVDTRRAVELSYELAGVKMPRWAWGEPWQSWLSDAARHQRKNQVYPTVLKLWGRALPLLQVALRLDAPVITGASAAAVTAVQIALAPGLNVQLTGATVWQKIDWLNVREPGVYVDDTPRVRATMKEMTRWKIRSPQVCLRSFSPRVRTPD